VNPVVLAHEVDARHLGQEDAFVVVTLTARLGDCEEQIHLGLPCASVRPLLSQASRRQTAPATPAATPSWNELFDDVAVPVSAEFGELQLTAREVATLQVGDQLPLGPDWAERIQLCLAGRPTFRGRLGTQDANWAVELTQQLENQP
jgi:flagellar motor switch protein FliM